MNRGVLTQGKGRGNIQEMKKKYPCQACGKLGHWKHKCKVYLENNEMNLNFNQQMQNEMIRNQQQQQQIVTQVQIPQAPMPGDVNAQVQKYSANVGFHTGERVVNNQNVQMTSQYWLQCQESDSDTSQ